MSAFDSDLNYLPTGNLLTGAAVYTTLTGIGYQLYPAIGEDAIYCSDENDSPFICRFELPWGWETRTTAFNGGANVKVVRDGHWEINYSATPTGRRGDMQVESGTGNLGIRWFASGGPERLMKGQALRQAYWIGVKGIPREEFVHSTQGVYGTASALGSSSGFSVEYWHPAIGKNVQVPVPVEDLMEVQIAANGSAVMASFVQDEAVYFILSSDFGNSWSPPMLVASGEQTALACCKTTGIVVCAVWRDGTWHAYRKLPGSEEFVLVGEIATLEKARAGLEFATGGSNLLVFTVPDGVAVKRYCSADYGLTWVQE